MIPWSLSPNPTLLDASRLCRPSRLGSQTSALELVTLLGCGALAAVASTMLELNLRIPGHAIVRAVLPIALGLSLVPRRGAGTVMTASALLSLIVLSVLGLARVGSGALTSLALIGPALDVAARSARSRPWIPLSFALAGLATNLAALAVRASTKALGWERGGGGGGGGGGGRQFAQWWPEAIGTYALCGLLAGLMGALLWFHVAGAGRTSGEAAGDRA